MKRLLAQIFAAAALLTCLPASASLITYQLTFTVLGAFSMNGEILPDNMITPPVIGQAYSGHMTVDDGSAHSVGPLTAMRVVEFYAQIGQSIWDSSQIGTTTSRYPDFYDFFGYRGACYSGAPALYSCTADESAQFGFGSPLLGFDGEGGGFTRLYGGVFGQADFPWIDFWGDRFSASSRFLSDYAPSSAALVWTPVALNGTLTLTRVAEPGILALLLSGVLGMCAVRGRHRRFRLFRAHR